MEDGISGELNSQQKRQIAIINRNSNQLLKLINEVLDLSKIEAGKMPIEIINFRIGDLAESLEKTFQPLLDRKGIEFKVDISKRVQRSIRNDSQKIRQILVNLIGNAVKFTNEGGVTLEVDEEEIEGKRFLNFSVIDTGSGISRKNYKKIFKAFQQEGPVTKKADGTGLGLTISQKLIRVLGGTISIKSESNKGSTFSFKIPL